MGGLFGSDHETTMLGSGGSNRENATRPYLTVFRAGSAAVIQFPHDGIYIIGRAADAHIVIDESAVSRRHAEIHIGGPLAMIKDCDSVNGTHLDGRRVHGEAPLAAGSVISMGDTEMVFHWRIPRAANRIVLDRPNFDQLLEAEVERSVRHAHPLTLVLFGLEAAAKEVAQAIVRSMRRMDRIARLDEGTIALLLPEVGSEDAPGACERILMEARRMTPTLKGGIAHWPEDGYDMDTLLAAARTALEQAPSGRVIGAQQTVLELRLARRPVAFADPAMMRLFALAKRLAQSDIPVLISGETGVGKEIFATALHELSPRAQAPMMSINCAALPETLVESELFGHARGAFSGAAQHRIGKLEAADGGTVFLDEVGELPPMVQAKLLRVLDEKTVTRLGENEPRAVDIRIVAATNRDLREHIAQGRFRQDLYFRLGGAQLLVPPLRERPRDVPLLARTILAELAGKDGQPMTISAEAMGILAAYNWPGNVRELRHALSHAAAVAVGKVIETWMLPRDISGVGADTAAAIAAAGEAGRAFRPIDEEMRDLEIKRMKEALEAAGGVQTRAAALISMPLRTFQAKCRKYGLGSRPGRTAKRTGSQKIIDSTRSTRPTPIVPGTRDE
jgi:DNA-binding NtrC family response regulator